MFHFEKVETLSTSSQQHDFTIQHQPITTSDNQVAEIFFTRIHPTFANNSL